ncbi:MAG: hypothetical protein HONBIEJF_00373 [Fimbriimonadaceae bacterium]|nr:hypothetical protein [Fimbriimonadaceae bacterium]
MRRLRGITLIEVLCVIAIIGIIAAIAYPVFQGGKEKSKEVSCMQQLRQIHMALAMYGNDYPGYLPVHENIDIPNAPMLHSSKLLPYLPDRRVQYCPDTPQCVKEEYFSTYTWMARWEDTTREGYDAFMKRHNAHFDDPEKPFPIVFCLIHDELYYYPREREMSPEYNPPFVVQLYADGHAKAGRLHTLRNFTIARACYSSPRTLER